MTSLQATVRRHLTTILLLLLVGGYLVILGELFLYQHWDGPQLIGFSATVLGLLAVLLGLIAKGGLRMGLAILLAILSISGLIGVYEHYESRSERGGAARPPLTQTSVGTTQAATPTGADAQSVAPQEGGEERPGGPGRPEGFGGPKLRRRWPRSASPASP